MRPFAALTVAFLVCGLLLFSPSTATSRVSVLTHLVEKSRSGQHLHETPLNSTNVQMIIFRRCFSQALDCQVYPQPLYGLTIQGTTRNALYAATGHNSVYVFGADDPKATLPLWQFNLGPSVPGNDVCLLSPDDLNCPNLDACTAYDITATPVDTPFSWPPRQQTQQPVTTICLRLTSSQQRKSSGDGIESSNGTVCLDAVHQGNSPACSSSTKWSIRRSPPSPKFLRGTAGFSVTTPAPCGNWRCITLRQRRFSGMGGRGNGLREAGNICVMTGNACFDSDSSGRTMALSTSAGL